MPLFNPNYLSKTLSPDTIHTGGLGLKHEFWGEHKYSVHPTNQPLPIKHTGTFAFLLSYFH